MATPKTSDIGLKFSAFSSALTEMIASLSCENAVLRDLLVSRGVLSDGEYENAVAAFGKDRWEDRKNQVHKRVHELMTTVLAQTKSGGQVQ